MDAFREPISQAFSSLGANGLGILLVLLFGSVALHLALGHAKFRWGGLAIGAALGVAMLVMMPVYTDAPTPPWTLELLPAIGVASLCAGLPVRRAWFHAATVAVVGLIAHEAWISTRLDGYLADPQRSARWAKHDVDWQIKFAHSDWIQEDLKAQQEKALPPGYLDEQPYSDVIGVKPLKRVVWATEWHSPLTGLYRDRSRPVRLWTPGGTPKQAIAGIQAVEVRPL